MSPAVVTHVANPCPALAVVDVPRPRLAQDSPVWHQDSGTRREYIDGLYPVLQDPGDPGLAQVLVALSDPVYENRNAAAKLVVRATYELIYSGRHSPTQQLHALDGVFGELAHPTFLEESAHFKDPRLGLGEIFDPRRTLAHTRFMALRMIQHAAEESMRCLPIFVAYGEFLERESGLMTRAQASRCAQASGSVTPASLRERDLPEEITKTKPAFQLWRILQATRAYLNWHPHLVEQHAWARGIQQSWASAASHIPQLQNCIL